MSQHPMVWTGLHIPDAAKPQQYRQPAINAVPAPCDGCSLQQRRACRVGPLTCVAYLDFHFRGRLVERDADLHPALPELVPLLEHDPHGTKQIAWILRQARQISDAWGAPPVVAEPPAPPPPPAPRAPRPTPKRRIGRMARAIINALAGADEMTASELQHVVGMSNAGVYYALQLLSAEGLVEIRRGPNPLPLGPRELMLVRAAT